MLELHVVNIIIAGSGTVTPQHARSAILRCPLIHFVSATVCGMVRVTDRHGACHNGLPVLEYRADWERHGKAAGLEERQMAAIAEGLVAAWNGNSPGTSNILMVARETNVRIWWMERGRLVFGMDAGGELEHLWEVAE